MIKEKIKFDWLQKANCIGMDVNIFFSRDLHKAKKICKVCVVKDECFKFGLYENYGMFGGKTVEQRWLYRCENKLSHKHWRRPYVYNKRKVKAK
jgi:hypothetical protein